MRIFDFKLEKKYQKDFLEGSTRILNEGFLSNHKFVKRFEEKFKKTISSNYSLSTSSGTSSLEIILRSLNIFGKDILVNSNTFIATGHAIKNAGGNIVPVDIEKNYYLLCPDDLRKKITKKTGAVIIVHIGGMISPNIFKIQKICRDNNVPLIEDAAQAFYSKYKGIYAGNFGDAAAFSFFTTKVMTTGEGGMIVTKFKKIYENCLSLRQFGYTKKNNLLYDKISNNYKLNEFSALLGLIELKRVKKRIYKRNKIAKFYQNFFLNNKKFKLLGNYKNLYCNYYKQIFISKIERNKIEKVLISNNIPLTGGVYYFPLHKQPVFIKKLKKYNLPNTDFFCKSHFCPPCYPELKMFQVKKICDVLNSIF